ncbi:hypothetical protein CAEBREN_10162 [Caenorhabditis brenneri]|uniref:Uncharacterized protein n=1 Tax=Caenorhabditis brenneri TaxID=135651 RepID=G0MX22_CAEBE|nr:hypothetical protein CAEBREN_10162 [Caenorhabditis brenneri]
MDGFNSDEDGPLKKVKRVDSELECFGIPTYDCSHFNELDSDVLAVDNFASNPQTLSPPASLTRSQQNVFETLNDMWYFSMDSVPTITQIADTLDLFIEKRDAHTDEKQQSAFVTEDIFEKGESKKKYVTVTSTWIPPFEDLPAGNPDTPFNNVLKMDIFVTNTPRDKNWIPPPLCDDLKLFLHGFLKHRQDAKRTPEMAVKIINERIFEFVGKRIEPCIISTLLYGTREIPSVASVALLTQDNRS